MHGLCIEYGIVPELGSSPGSPVISTLQMKEAEKGLGTRLCLSRYWVMVGWYMVWDCMIVENTIMSKFLYTCTITGDITFLCYQ